MYVNAPRRLKPGGDLVTVEGVHMQIAPSGANNTTVGYTTKEAAIAAAFAQNTTYSTTVARSYRTDMTSGVTGYKAYKNTKYRAYYMRRRVLNRGKYLSRHKTTGKYYVESVPIRLGATDVTYTGWLDSTLESIVPYSGDNRLESVYNRTVMASLQRRGIVECKQKMLESKMDLAESLVDMDKTVMLIAERAMTVLLAWQHMRKGNHKKALEVLGISKKSLNSKSAAEAWLEVQYAWLPLLNDVYSGVEVVKDLLGDPLAHHTYAKRRVKEPLWAPKLSPQNNEWTGVSQSATSLCEVETKFRFRVENSLLAYITGFKLSNPLYVFWVAMPFTFVVDWFLPIGDWLDSLTATHGLQFVDGYQTTVNSMSVRVSGTKRVTWRHIWDEIEPLQAAESIVECGCIDRVIFTGWPMSYTYFTFPFTSPQRIASAISLTRVTAGLR